MDLKEKYSSLLKKRESLQEELTRIDTEYNLTLKEHKKLISELKELGYSDIEQADLKIKELEGQIQDCLEKLEGIFNEVGEESNEGVF